MQIGFNRRYDVGHHLLKQHLKQKIGRLEKIIITSRDPSPPSLKYLKSSGGIFKDMMIHDFDLARYYLGKDEFNQFLLWAVTYRINVLIKLMIMNWQLQYSNPKKGFNVL